MAKYLDAQRISWPGRSGCDVKISLIDWELQGEIKMRDKVPASVFVRALEQAEQHFEDAFAVVHQNGERYERAVVVMRLRTFKRLLEGYNGLKENWRTVEDDKQEGGEISERGD